MERLRILGIDPSLVRCGWGVVDIKGSKLTHVAHGVIAPPRGDSLPARLQHLHAALLAVVEDTRPHTAAVEDAFMKDNAQSALKLGQARAACILAATASNLPVGEYAPRSVKQAVVGSGAATKDQVAHMVNILLPGQALGPGDAADALAVAICHSHRAGPDLARAGLVRAGLARPLVS